MTYVITDQCDLQCRGECLDVCPVDVIHGPIRFDAIGVVPLAERPARFPEVQMYIDPEGCIHCGACEEVCPSKAIFDEDDLPAGAEHARARNAAFFTAR